MQEKYEINKIKIFSRNNEIDEERLNILDLLNMSLIIYTNR